MSGPPPADTELTGFVEALWLLDNGGSLKVIGVDGTLYYSRFLPSDIGVSGSNFRYFSFAEDHTKLHVWVSNTGGEEVYEYNIFAYPTGLSLQYVGLVYTAVYPEYPAAFDPELPIQNWCEAWPIGMALTSSLDANSTPPFDSVNGIGLAAINQLSDASHFVWKHGEGVALGGSEPSRGDEFSDGHRYLTWTRVTSISPQIFDWFLIAADDGGSEYFFANRTGGIYTPTDDWDTVLVEYPLENQFRQSFFHSDRMYILGSQADIGTPDPYNALNRHGVILQNTVPPAPPSTYLFDSAGTLTMRVYKAPVTLIFCEDDSCLPPPDLPGLSRYNASTAVEEYWQAI